MYVVFISLLLSITIFGQLEYKFKDVISISEGDPVFYFTPQQRVQNLVVTVESPKQKPKTYQFSGIPENVEKSITIKQQKGVFIHKISLKGKYVDTTTFEDNFEMKGVKLDSFLVNIKKDSVNLEKGIASFSTNREATKVELKVINNSGIEAESRVIEHNPPSKKTDISWEKTSDLKELQITVYDQYGFWTGLSIMPFTVDIPHKEIQFESGKWEVRKTEIPKIKDTIVKINDVLKKHAKDITLNLYIAGYTDTVGTPESNMILSKNRAKAIGEAFKKEGLKLTIYYQGFGESVLKRLTNDEVDDPMNRRAIYILSSQSPDISKTIPSKHWTHLE
ncbi:OmpA family protein [bacterium]|nr:OmpA family protein [bacterium]